MCPSCHRLLVMFCEQLKTDSFRNFLLKTIFSLKNRKYAKTGTRLFIGIPEAQHQVSTIGVSLFEQQYQSQRTTISIICQPFFDNSVSFAEHWSANYRRMKYSILKIKFLLENVIVERWGMSHSIRLERLFHIRQ